jgi:hypothetical protein
MDGHEKASAGETAKAKSYDGGEGLNLRQHTSPNTSRSKAENAAERLLECGGENLLDAGLRAADRGWKIFPCKSDKTPLVQWSQAATADEATITAWAKHWPGALWGRALPADTLVLDLDQKRGKNGIKEFEQLQGCKPEQFGAPRTATATGGNHIYTDATDREFKNTRSVIAPGHRYKDRWRLCHYSERGWLLSLANGPRYPQAANAAMGRSGAAKKLKP